MSEVLMPEPLHGYIFTKHMCSTATHETFAARRASTGEAVVVRVYALAMLREDEELRHNLERRALVAKLVDAHPCMAQSLPSFTTNTDAFVIERFYANGELLELLQALPPPNNTLPMEAIKHIMRQLLHALHFLHEECAIAHRNVKLETILIDDDFGVRLSGFDRCAALPSTNHHGPESSLLNNNNNNSQHVGVVDGRGASRGGLLRLCVGSAAYIAPEVAAGSAYRGEPVDVWAAGVCFFALLTGLHPFASADASNATVCDVLRRSDDHLAQHAAFAKLSEEPYAQDLVRAMLIATPAARLTVVEALQHPFLARSA